jgi:DNA-binding LacI/PurR family transcriptional regulator
VPVTLFDIAWRLGLSEATVSRCLRGVGRRHPDTIARVRAVATTLGYDTNRPRRPYTRA